MKKGGGTILRKGLAVSCAVLTGAIAGIGVGAQPAQAQSPVPIRLKLGALIATDSDVKKAAGDVLFSSEVDVTIPLAKISVSLGYTYGKKGNSSLTSVPLLVNKLFSPPNPLAGTVGNVYFGAGAGVYFLRRGGYKAATDTKIGGRAFVGYQFPKPYFVEAQYHLVAGGVNGLSPNGPVFYGGYKF